METPVSILALEPFYGGSHRAFLDQWRQHSHHQFTLLTLPGRRWKWRMRHAAPTFARQLRELPAPLPCDLIWCSSMLDLATFRGLLPSAWQSVPSALYFHENQLTYPVQHEQRRDCHFAFTNVTSCFCADAIWFNSDFHRREFFAAAERFLQAMPDFPELELLLRARARAVTLSPGISPLPAPPRERGPLRILWSARWEFDKNPETFFEALHLLREQGVSFTLDVVGERYARSPAIFEQARADFAPCINQWGYVESSETYRQILQQADVIVSTAIHEFFGISILEAVEAGAWPLVPERLAYPETLATLKPELRPLAFYDGTARQLCARLVELDRIRPRPADDLTHRFHWHAAASRLDDAVESFRSDRS